MSLSARRNRRDAIRMAGLNPAGTWLIVQVAKAVLPALAVRGCCR